MTTHDAPPQRPPDDFFEQVKHALENLYDLPLLNRHALAAGAPHGAVSEPQGQRLRRELITTIEALNPGKDLAQRTNAVRTYNLLHMHYVGGMTLQEVANQLGISLRQAYRDLKTGCEGVGEMVWFNRRSAEQDDSHLSSLESELARLEGSQAPTELTVLLDGAIKAVQRLMEQQAVTLMTDVPPTPVILSANPAAAQQVFISLFSGAIQASKPGQTLTAALTQSAQNWLFDLTFIPREAAEMTLSVPIREFIKQLRFDCTQTLSPQGVLTLHLKMPSYGTRILMIDDNQGLADLLQRFLPEPRYKVIAATTGAEGLRHAVNLQPDIILLDLMMPDLNGWDVLQRLRADERTRAIPVAICSVVSDPELAYSLGANLIIAKPINRESILSALDKLERR